MYVSVGGSVCGSVCVCVVCLCVVVCLLVALCVSVWLLVCVLSGSRVQLVGSGGGVVGTKMGVWKRTTVKHARIFNKSWRFLHDD